MFYIKWQTDEELCYLLRLFSVSIVMDNLDIKKSCYNPVSRRYKLYKGDNYRPHHP